MFSFTLCLKFGLDKQDLGRKSLGFALITVFLLPKRYQASPCQPTQIHLSFGDIYYSISQGILIPKEASLLNDNQAYLVWHSKEFCNYFVIISDPSTFQTISNASMAFWNDFYYDFDVNKDTQNTGIYQTKAYTALLKGLEYGRTYQYILIETTRGISMGPFEFRMTSPYLEQKSKKLLIAGDIDAFENGMHTIKALSKLVIEFIKLVTKKTTDNYDDYSGWLLLGDISYNLQDENGLRGDNFFDTIQSFVNICPIMVALGNHDYYANWSFVNLRIRNPLFNSTSNHYFSLNLQGIHFTFVNLDQYEHATPEKQAEILEWIDNDLTIANSPENRQKWPWILFVVHRPIYCSHFNPSTSLGKQCFSLYQKRQIWDELMHKHSVDLTIMAHKHSYERMGPIYQNKSAEFTKMDNDPNHHNIIDPAATVFIMDGAGGQSYFTPEPYSPSGYTWFTDVQPGYSVLYTEDNANDRRLVFEHYISATGEKIDFMNLIKTKPQSVLEESRGSWLILFLAICIVLVLILGSGYWFWRKKKEHQRKQNEEFYQFIPLVDIKRIK